MNLFRAISRHPFVWLAGLVLASATLWIGYFLATFDLDNYREQVASELSNRLQMPVRLGKAHLELREAGIAFSFTDLQIGTEQTSSELHAQKIWLQLAWHGLLLKKPILTEVALNSPRLRLAPSTAASPDDTPPTSSFNLEVLRDLHIRRVEVNQGSLDISWLDPAGVSRTFSLGDLSIELDNLGLSRTVAINAVGNLLRHSDQARLAVKGSVELPAAGNWRDATWDLALEAKALEASRLAGLLPERTDIRADGQVDLALYFKGTPSDSMTAQAELSGQQLRIRPGSAYRQSIPLKHLQLAGTWQSKDGNHQLRQLAVQFDDLRLSGEITINSTATAHEISGNFGNSTLPVDTLRRWLPDELLAAQPLSARMQPGGLLTIRQAAFRVSVPVAKEGHITLELEGAEGEVSSLAWAIDETTRAELAALNFRLQDNRWHFDQGSATVSGLPIAFSGTVTPQHNAPAQLSIELASHTTAEQLLGLWRKQLPADLTLTGALALQGHLTGTAEQMLVDARLDLAQLDVRYGKQLHLPPTPGAACTLQGQMTGNTLTIDQSNLNFPPMNGRLTGGVDWTGPLTVEVATRLELPDLAASYELAPALGKLQLKGGVAVDLTINGPAESAKPRVSVELHDVSIPTHGFVADISQLNGRLLLVGKGINSENLTARLGQSPVTLKATVADLGAPRLLLDVRAPSIRADELIFRSDLMVLRDLDGHLIFDRDGLFFAPVKVRLDGGTRATVNGSVKNFDAPQVDLDITGEYANIKEIIGLWTEESPTATTNRHARQKESAHHSLPPIRIAVEAQEGDLYSMKFAKAKALIVPTAERLLIHPLDFNIGEGYCTTQVLVDYSGSDTLLRVSGHVEDVDAYEIYNELLDRKSIMRGRLRGDFYLQGELGGHGFLPTSYGNFSFSVRDGVMRHSPVMSTLFSLLNVSQLFKFKLPDVNLEGLPFTLMTGELAVSKGIMSTENIRIDSEAMNMSYVGNYDMVRDRLDLLVVVKPLGTVDKVVTSLPIAGWILGGDQQALITAQFRVTGTGADPNVKAIPISSISKGILGLFQRALSLPLKLIDDPEILWGGGGEKKN